MIRIVDILKKAGEWDIPEEEKAPSPAPAKPPAPEAPKTKTQSAAALAQQMKEEAAKARAEAEEAARAEKLKQEQQRKEEQRQADLKGQEQERARAKAEQLKKAEEIRQQEARRAEEERKKSQSANEESSDIFSEIIGLLKEGTTAAPKLLLLPLGRMVDAQLAGDWDLVKVLRRSPEDQRYLHAVEIALHSVKLGIDANYDREKLTGLAAAAIGFDLKQTIPGSSEYQSIINLAEIYEQSAH